MTMIPVVMPSCHAGHLGICESTPERGHTADEQAKAEAYRIAIMVGGMLGRRDSDERRR